MGVIAGDPEEEDSSVDASEDGDSVAELSTETSVLEELTCSRESVLCSGVSRSTTGRCVVT